MSEMIPLNCRRNSNND